MNSKSKKKNKVNLHTIRKNVGALFDNSAKYGFHALLNHSTFLNIRTTLNLWLLVHQNVTLLVHSPTELDKHSVQNVLCAKVLFTYIQTELHGRCGNVIARTHEEFISRSMEIYLYGMLSSGLY